MICLTLKSSQSFFVYHIQNKEFFLQKMSFLYKRGVEDWTKKWKEGFLTALTTAIKKDLTILIWKHSNELKVHKKTVRTAIKQFKPIL